MANYLLTYSGGSGMPETEAEQAAVMQQWGTWYEELGEAIVNPGNPVGEAKTVSPGGDVTDGGAVTGFTIISADNLNDAVKAAQGCPIVASGGNVEVGETIQM